VKGEKERRDGWNGNGKAENRGRWRKKGVKGKERAVRKIAPYSFLKVGAYDCN